MSDVVEQPTVRGEIGRTARPPIPMNEFLGSGVLWAINKHLFHPMGFALAFDKGDDGELVGWQILGDGKESWKFDSDEDYPERFAELLNARRSQ